MLLFNSKKINIILEYNSETLNIHIEPFKTVKHLKEMIAKVIYPLNFQPILQYADKDISANESQILGDIFKTRNNVNIKIIQPSDKKEVKNKVIGKSISILPVSSISERKSNMTPDNSSFKSVFKNKKIQKCKCNNLEISNYCCVCKEYLCNNCKKANHAQHKVIKLDSQSIEESIRLYSISLQAELTKNLNKLKEYDLQVKSKIFIDIQSRKEMLMRKLDQLEDLYNSKIIEDENRDNKYVAFEKNTNEINKDIEKIIDELTFNMLNGNGIKNNTNYEKAKDFFDSIFAKEKLVEDLAEEVKSYGEYYEFNKKLDEMYHSVDVMVDSMMNDLTLLKKKRKKLSSMTQEKFKIDSKDVEIFDSNKNKREIFKSSILPEYLYSPKLLEFKPRGLSIQNQYQANTPQVKRLLSNDSRRDSLSSIPFNSSIGFNINTHANINSNPKIDFPYNVTQSIQINKIHKIDKWINNS